MAEYPIVVPQNATELLAEFGMSEYALLFDVNGITDVLDALSLSKAELEKIGMEKVGHQIMFQRKAKQYVEQQLARRHALQLEEDAEGGRLECVFDGEMCSGPVRDGTFVEVEIICATVDLEALKEVQNFTTPAHELKMYVKVTVCNALPSGHIEIISDQSVKTKTVCSTVSPRWAETFRINTDFADGNFIMIELKHQRSIGSNSRLGYVFLPMRYFHPFSNETKIDNWFPIQRRGGFHTGDLHMRLCVPGGTPRQILRAYKVTGVKMESKKLVITVFEAKLNLEKIQTVVPMTDSPGYYVKMQPSDKPNIYGRTKVCRTNPPVWHEDFTFFSEIKNSKLMVFKLKVQTGLTNRCLIGEVHLPLLHFLAQNTDTEQWFPCFDNTTSPPTVVGEIHIGLSVLLRDAKEALKLNTSQAVSQPHVTPVILPGGNDSDEGTDDDDDDKDNEHSMEPDVFNELKPR